MKITQQNKILNLLKQMGSVGINSYDLTYIHSIKQAPTRVKELRLQGYSIISKPLSNRSVQYILTPTVSKLLPEVTQSWEEELVPVVKNGRTYWERPEDLKPKQLDILKDL